VTGRLINPWSPNSIQKLQEEKIPKQSSTIAKKFTFGTRGFSKTSPSRTSLSAETRVLNIIVSFDDALKLSIAIDECVRKLNSYNRSFRAGRNAALNFTLHLDKGRITINEGKL
jgi:hypothetical protein